MVATLNDAERATLQPRQRLVLVMLRSAWNWREAFCTCGHGATLHPYGPCLVAQDDPFECTCRWWKPDSDDDMGTTDPTMVDGWVNGHLLCAPHLGGSEGLRRIRELRSLGYPIEKRRKPVKGSTEYQYRVAVERRLP